MFVEIRNKQDSRVSIDPIRKIVVALNAEKKVYVFLGVGGNDDGFFSDLSYEETIRLLSQDFPECKKKAMQEAKKNNPELLREKRIK